MDMEIIEPNTQKYLIFAVPPKAFGVEKGVRGIDL